MAAEPNPGSGPEPAIVAGVGASAGGVEALMALVRELPHDFPGALLVVLHVSPSGTSALAEILDRAGPLPAIAAPEGEPLRAGRVYVARPDRHLLVEEGVIRCSAGPRENGHRPAVDPTFRSLAVFGERAVGVILSGTRDDGTQGLARIKAAGGVALVQDPAEAAYAGMINSATDNVEVDEVLPVAGIAQRLVQMARGDRTMSDPMAQPTGDDRDPTRFTCPECGGHMEREAGAVPRYVCMVGHAYSQESFDGAQAQAVENALWAALRLLDDRAALLTEMAGRADSRGHNRSAGGFRASAEDAEEAARTLRAMLEAGRVPTGGAVEGTQA